MSSAVARIRCRVVAAGHRTEAHDARVHARVDPERAPGRGRSRDLVFLEEEADAGQGSTLGESKARRECVSILVERQARNRRSWKKMERLM